MSGKIYLLPITLGGNNITEVIPTEVIKRTISLRFFITENTRTTRRFLRLLDSSFPIDDSTFFELNKHSNSDEISSYLLPAKKGNDIGVMSEAGVPGIADPGAEIVALAHKQQLQVVPLVGPSSILLAVMAAGMNGQNFAFNGYLPIKSEEKIKRIKELERRSKKEKQTQVFIETPYRNGALLTDILKSCQTETMLSIAANITLEDEFIKTHTIGYWKKHIPNIDKKPCIFSIQSY